MGDPAGNGRWVFPRAAHSAAEARQRVAEFLGDLPKDSREVVLLLTSELVTNALQHGAGPVHVALSPTQLGLRIEVHDDSDAPPRVLRPSVDALGGRGLLMVEGLASSWGFDTRHGEGKTVWFTVRS